MAVMVVPKQKICPKCFETLAYTSKDVHKSTAKKPVFDHTIGAEKARQRTLITTRWYVTCPTCEYFFLVEEFSRFEDL